MKHLILISLILMSSLAASADTFNPMDGISCNGWRGVIKNKYTDGNVRIQWSEYISSGSSVPKNTVQLLNPEQTGCKVANELGDSEVLNEYKKGDAITCNGWRGKIQNIYKDGYAKILWNEYVSSGSSVEKNTLNMIPLDTSGCSPASEITESKGFRRGDDVSCNGWRGTVISVYKDGVSRVQWKEYVSGGSIYQKNTRQVLNLATTGCQVANEVYASSVNDQDRNQQLDRDVAAQQTAARAKGSKQ